MINRHILNDRQEDVLGVDDDDDDDTADVEMYKAQLSRMRNQGIKEDMGSDLEDDDDGGWGLVSGLSWLDYWLFYE